MAAIDHAFITPVTTDQTHTGSTNWTDISGVSIASGSFTTGKKYLIVANAQCGSSSSTQMHGHRLVHGSTAFAESEKQERRIGNFRYNYFWFTVWTAVSGEGIKMQHRISSAGATVNTDNITLVAINLSDDVTENTDWFFAEDSVDDALTTAFQSYASTTFTPGTAGDDWLVMAYSQIDFTNNVQAQYQTRLSRSGEASSTTPQSIQEDGISLDQIYMHGLPPRVFNLGSASNTFTVQSREILNPTGSHLHSAVFALNLNKFRAHQSVWTDTATQLDTTNFGNQLSTVSIDPVVTSDIWAIAGWVSDVDSASVSVKHRLRSGTSGSETDDPATQTADAYVKEQGDVDNENANIVQTMTSSVAAGSRDYDSDASASATSATGAKQRGLFAVTMELAAEAETPSALIIPIIREV